MKERQKLPVAMRLGLRTSNMKRRIGLKRSTFDLSSKLSRNHISGNSKENLQDIELGMGWVRKTVVSELNRRSPIFTSRLREAEYTVQDHARPSITQRLGPRINDVSEEEHYSRVLGERDLKRYERPTDYSPLPPHRDEDRYRDHYSSSRRESRDAGRSSHEAPDPAREPRSRMPWPESSGKHSDYPPDHLDYVDWRNGDYQTEREEFDSRRREGSSRRPGFRSNLYFPPDTSAPDYELPREARDHPRQDDWASLEYHESHVHRSYDRQREWRNQGDREEFDPMSPYHHHHSNDHQRSWADQVTGWNNHGDAQQQPPRNWSDRDYSWRNRGEGPWDNQNEGPPHSNNDQSHPRPWAERNSPWVNHIDPRFVPEELPWMDHRPHPWAETPQENPWRSLIEREQVQVWNNDGGSSQFHNGRQGFFQNRLEDKDFTDSSEESEDDESEMKDAKNSVKNVWKFLLKENSLLVSHEGINSTMTREFSDHVKNNLIEMAKEQSKNFLDNWKPGFLRVGLVRRSGLYQIICKDQQTLSWALKQEIPLMDGHKFLMMKRPYDWDCGPVRISMWLPAEPFDHLIALEMLNVENPGLRASSWSLLNISFEEGWRQLKANVSGESALYLEKNGWTVFFLNCVLPVTRMQNKENLGNDEAPEVIQAL